MMGQSYQLQGASCPQPHCNESIRIDKDRLDFDWDVTEITGASRGQAGLGPAEFADDDVIELVLSDGSTFPVSGATYRRDFLEASDDPAISVALCHGQPVPLMRQLPGRSGTARGVTDEIEKILVSRVSEWLGESTALTLAHAYERLTLHPQVGASSGVLLEWNRTQRTWEPVSPGPGRSRSRRAPKTADAVTAGPVLLLLHGTFSHTRGAFGNLWESDEGLVGETFREFEKRYRKIYSFEHRTLTVSPIRNAIDLVEALPGDVSELHVVSHSRGGQVGELLCRVQRVDEQGQRIDQQDLANVPRGATNYEYFDDTDFKSLTSTTGTTVANELKELNAALSERRRAHGQLSINRFVRIAAPIRGTSLAGERVDLLVSLFFKAVEFIELLDPSFSAAVTIGQAEAFVKALIAARRDLATLPGLACMDPKGLIVGLLNRDTVQSTADLTVIAGDLHQGRLHWRIVELVADWIFKGDNDLIVNTNSMDAGMHRVQVSTSGGMSRLIDHGFYHLEKGSDVGHCSYFTNATSLEKLRSRLGDFDPYTSQGFAKLKAVNDSELARSANVSFGGSVGALPANDKARGERPIVVILPGIMGSELSFREEPIWARPHKLMWGGLRKLSYDRQRPDDVDGVTADNLLPDPYAALCRYLSDSHDVIRFPYDWRASLKEAARLLAVRLEGLSDIAEANDQPLRFVAHSMGGLVLGALIAFYPGVWKRARKHAKSRAVLLGSPLEGSWSIIQLLRLQEPILKKVALIDFRSSHEDLVHVAKNFPGVLELLPQNRVTNSQSAAPALWSEGTPFDEKVWDRWGAQLSQSSDKLLRPDSNRLREAREVRDRLQAIQWNQQSICYVSGSAEQTPIGIAFIPDRSKFLTAVTRQGDGRVPWNLDALNGVNRWYMDAEHGDLANHREKFGAILDLLQSGQTTQLSTVGSTLSRGAAGRPDVEYVETLAGGEDLYPTAESLAWSAVGSLREHGQGTAQPGRRSLISVGVVHGDLLFARFPVAVGHYDGDPLVGPERKLDEALNGRLTERQSWGLYAGRIESSEIVLATKPGQRPQGAIVIGLGRAGELTPALLQQTLMKAILKYATKVAEMTDAALIDVENKRRRVRLSALLIGTSANGLPVAESMEAMLRAIMEVADRLQSTQRNSTSADEFPLEITDVEFIELYDDHAGLADRSLLKLVKRTPFDSTFHYEAFKECGGRQQRQSSTDAPGWWHRMQITRNRRGLIKFDMLTRRARTETHVLQEQTAVLKLLARQATSSTLTQTDICRTLFQMLLPNPLKEAAVWNQYLQLIVDPKAAELPWELLWDRDFEKPPVVTAGMLRQLKTTQFRQKPRETYENIACVIGDPVGTDSKPIGEFPALEGAKNEALLVTDVLRQHGYQVRDVIRQSFIQVFKAMHERGYRILHLAGHGVHEYVKKHKVDLSGLPLDPESFDCISRCLMKNNEKPVSGMVVGSIDNQLAVLGPPEVEQMLCVPELVFINCCELGAMESVTHRLSNPPAYAANIAEQFIRMGVRCVIAAGWQIDDSAARTFAEVFYDLFLQGETFGTAVRRAREETYDRHQTVNTWGAYQCYGDPGWRLVSPRDRRLMKQLELPDWTSAHDAVIGLQNFVQRAKTSVPSTATKKVAELDLIYREMNSPQRPWHQWLDRADVTGELGIAFSEVGYFNVAAKLLWNCSRLNFSKPPSTTQERLCDAFNRLAFQVNGDHAWLASFREFFFGGSHPKIPIGTNKYTEAARLLLESQRRLLTLLSLGETIELYQLLSSAFRRLAAIDQWHSTPSKTDDRNDRITLLKLAVLASNASLRLEVKREQEQARQRRTKWETSSWPEYTVVTLRVVLAILDPASIQIEPGWIPTSCSMLEVGHAVELPELAQQIAELQTIPSSNPANTTATSTTVNAAIDTDALRMVLTRDRISAWCDTMERLAKANEEQTPSFWNSSWQGGCALLRLLSELLPSKDKAQSRRQRIDDCAKLLKSGYEKAGNHGASGRERNSITQNLMLMSNLLRYANTQPGQPGQDVIRHAQQGLEQLVQYFARQWPL